MTHLQEWYEARKDCLEAPINDPEFKSKLRRLDDAEDALYKHAEREKKRNDELNFLWQWSIEQDRLIQNGANP